MLPDEGNEVLDVTDKQCNNNIDKSLPCDVIYERSLREAIDPWNHVRDEHDLGHHQRSDGCSDKGRDVDSVLLEHQCPGEGNDLKSNEEENRRRNYFKDLMLHAVENVVHG